MKAAFALVSALVLSLGLSQSAKADDIVRFSGNYKLTKAYYGYCFDTVMGSRTTEFDPHINIGPAFFPRLNQGKTKINDQFSYGFQESKTVGNSIIFVSQVHERLLGNQLHTTKTVATLSNKDRTLVLSFFNSDAAGLPTKCQYRRLPVVEEAN